MRQPRFVLALPAILVPLALVHCAQDANDLDSRTTLSEARPCPAGRPGALVERADALEIHAAVFADPTNPEKLAAWRALLPRYGDFYVVEGDLLVRGPDLENYVIEAASKLAHLSRTDEAPSPELFINIPEEGPGCWMPGERELTFSVDRATFCPACDDCDCPAYTHMLADLRTAAAGWEDACPECQVHFQHRPEHDAAPSTDDVLFVVRQCDIHPTLGLAFFPRDEAGRRYLDMAPQAELSGIGRVGILRHELGHILGYRHEQLDEGSGCFRSESGRWERVTPYDPRSVMHYPCGEAAGENAQLELSTFDISGHSEAYQRCGS